MRLLLVRHAIAEDAAAGGDGARKLTKEGRERMVSGAAALRELVPELELVITSPLVRARETAEILARAYAKRLPLVESEALAPEGGGRDVLRLVGSQKSVNVLALVGHEPNLSQLEGYLLTGEERSLAQLKKGAAALVDVGGTPAPGLGMLLWHLTPAQLRSLAP